MRRDRPPGIAGLAMAALALAGCGEDPGIERGLVPFKGSDTSALAPLRDDMTRTMRDRSYLKKSGAGGEPAAGPEVSGGSSPAGRSGPAPGPAPAPESGGGADAGPKPAGGPGTGAEPGPPTKGG